MKKFPCSLYLVSLFLFSLFAQLLPAAPKAIDNWQLREHANGEVYYLYVPDGIEAGSHYPVVLALHGCCWDGVLPTYYRVDPIAGGFHGFTHNEQVEPTFIIFPLSTGSWAAKRTRIIELLNDVMAEFPIDADRQILSGFSMGAAGVRDYLAALPGRFVAGIMIGATFGDAAGFNPAPLVDIPVWVGIGTADGAFANNRIAVSRWREAAGFDLGHDTGPMGIYPRFSSFARVGHGPAMEGAFGDLPVVEWALAQRRDGNKAPWVHFTSPDYAAIVEGGIADIDITGVAGDRDGAVTRLELWVNDELVLDQSEAEFSWKWPTAAQTPGVHRFRVKVTDNATPVGKTMEDELIVYIQAPKVVAEDNQFPTAHVGRFYRAALPLQSSTGPATWTLVRNNHVPPGLNLRSNGVLEGYPTTTGSYSFEVAIADLVLPMIRQSYTIEVAARPGQQAWLTDISVSGTPSARYAVGKWATGEPFELSGYGSPAGAYASAPHPYFDVILDDLGIPNAQILRMADMDRDSSAAEGIRFRVHGRARIYVAYNMGTAGTYPAWIDEQGFQPTGLTTEVYQANFTLLAREVSDDWVSLGGNARNQHGGRRHYLVIVESVDFTDALNLPGALHMEDNLLLPSHETWMGWIASDNRSLPWFRHQSNRWLFATPSGLDDRGGWYFDPASSSWLWTSPETYPFAYSPGLSWQPLLR